MAREIEDNYLRRRDLFALEYESGLTFHEVREFEDVTYEEFSELEDIESGTSLDNGFQELQDSNGDDILNVPSDNEFTILHVGIGIAPSVIEMFVSYPQGSRNKKSLPNVSENPTPGANFGMTDGDDSPYRSPTTKSELVIPPKETLTFNFHNPGDDTHEPLLKFEVRKYKVNVINPRDSMNRDVISNIVRPGSPAPIFPVGNFNSKSDFELEQDWGVTPVEKERIRESLNRGGGR